jgi:hypothetical protein
MTQITIVFQSSRPLRHTLVKMNYAKIIGTYLAIKEFMKMGRKLDGLPGEGEGILYVLGLLVAG